MIGKTLAVAAALAALFSIQVQAQTNQNGPGPAQGVVSGPAAGSPTSMRSPQAGPLETKHQRKAVHNQSQSVRNKAHQATGTNNDETGATGSSSPRYAPAPR
jgi:Spy/CpxP family protein refolding chaperone